MSSKLLPSFRDDSADEDRYGDAYMIEPDESDSMMVDDLMFYGFDGVGPYKPGLKRLLKEGLRKSRKLRLDVKAHDAVGWLQENHPELIAEYSEFARAPYPTTWIEVPPTIRERGDGAEVRRGWLIKNNDIYSFIEVVDELSVRTVLSPLVTTLHRPMSLSEQYKMADLGQMSRLGIDQLMWGRGLYEEIPVKVRKELRRQHSLGLTMPWKNIENENNKDNARQLLQGLAHGETAEVLAILMLLMRPNHTRVIREKSKDRRKSKGKWKTFFAHNVVTVDLESKPLVKRIKAAVRHENNLRRRHEVRGHYCHNEAAKRATSHTHHWEQVDDHRWECAYPHCDAKRWWRKAHERGSAEIGYVTKHYEVTDGRR